MDFGEMQQRAGAVRSSYARLEAQRHGRAWNTTELALGFVGDVGDLAKLVQAHVGVRAIESVPDLLAHELADCLWSVMVLADACGVDLESAFTTTMSDLETQLVAELGRE